MRLTCGAVVLMFLALPTQAGERQTDAWTIGVLRVEGAAANVREAAEVLQAASGDVAHSGRIQQIARMRSAANSLHKKVISARMATDVLGDAISPSGDQ